MRTESEKGLPVTRYRLENFEENIARLNAYLDTHDPSNLCAVFDVGTKATRLLVGSKKLPSTEMWKKTTFFNDGQRFPLGLDFDLFRGRLDIKSSGALEGVCFFLESYARLLNGRGMPKENMHGVGTAVFRWMNNQDEVTAHIRRHAGFDIHVLKPFDEAYLSCLSIFHTYTLGNPDQASFGLDDVILLFDQGGGSTEVSCFRPKGDAAAGKLDSLHDFGTVTLQRTFFDTREEGSEGNGPPDPTRNRNRISTQFGKVKEQLRKRVAEWPGFPDLRHDGAKIHAYGMGTALSKCLRGGNVFSQHNRTLTIEGMDAVLARECQDLERSSQQVKTLYAALKKEEELGGKAISDKLVLLYGLPVYQELLLKFGLDHLRFAGFGLRFGAYIAVCGGQRLNHLSPQEVADGMTGLAPNQTTVYLAHSSADRAMAERITEGLRKAGIGVWLDKNELRVGDRIISQMGAGIRSSRFMAVMISKESNKSDWVREEWEAKLADDKKTGRNSLLPIVVDDCDVPPFLDTRLCADFRSDYEAGLKDLLTAIFRLR